VLDAGEVVGRIMLHPQAPPGQPWFWTITTLDKPPSVYSRGYAATREQAMLRAFHSGRISTSAPVLMQRG
jgi:hypothetical protein